MGNSPSTVLPSGNLKWKTGNKNGTVPAPPSNLCSYDKLAKSADFKEYLCENLDSDYLVSSILANAVDDKVLLEGIQFFHGLDAEISEQISKEISNFQSIIAAGIDVRLHHTYKLAAQRLNSFEMF
jgi:hypothetical protein